MVKTELKKDVMLCLNSEREDRRKVIEKDA